MKTLCHAHKVQKEMVFGKCCEMTVVGKKESKKELEVRGFDPRASPMRTVRSTN